MNIEIVTIGDELMLGFTIDTNAAFIARELSSIGIRIVHRATVGDEAEHIQSAVRAALDRTGGVITTGGLGPTADDKTKPAIASLFGQEMVMNEDILTRLEARWKKRFGAELPVSNRQQAMVPQHAEILTNNHGSAPGILLRDAQQELDRAALAIRDKVGRYIYGEGDDDLASLMLDAARARNATIAVAESCTGGLLGMRLTAIPGSSTTFMGGVIAYDNGIKVRELHVDNALLVEHGAVSEPVARAMASNVRQRFATNIGIGITGIAGPGGGTPEKPVGTVWVAVDVDGEVHAVQGVLPGDRSEIRWRAAQFALDRLRRAFERETNIPGWTVRG